MPKEKNGGFQLTFSSVCPGLSRQPQPQSSHALWVNPAAPGAAGAVTRLDLGAQVPKEGGGHWLVESRKRVTSQEPHR